MSHSTAGIPTNITTATTTQVKTGRGILSRVIVNEDVVSSVVTIYDNITIGITADADSVSLSQTPAAGPNEKLTITGAAASGGVATLGKNNKITITAASNETARTFTITGTGVGGGALTEAITGPNATLTTGVKNFKTITSVAVDANTAGAVTVGHAAQSGTLIATRTAPATLLANHGEADYNVTVTDGVLIVTSEATDITVVTV